MTPDQFATITYRVVAKAGLADFQPTACYPARREVKTLTGLPPDIDPEIAVLEWAAQSASANEEFLVAFKTAENSFRIIRCEGAASESIDYFTDTPP